MEAQRVYHEEKTILEQRVITEQKTRSTERGHEPSGWLLNSSRMPAGPPWFTWDEALAILREDADSHWWNRSLARDS